MTTLDMSALTKRQRGVFGEVCCGNDLGHPQATLDALERKGLVESYDDELPGWPPVRVTRYTVQIGIHVQWAAWCEAQPDEPEE